MPLRRITRYRSPILKVASVQIQRYCLARSAPLVTATTSAALRHGWWVTLHTEHGRIGRGEAAPWPGFGRGFAATRRALMALPTQLQGETPTSILNQLAANAEHLGWPSAIRYAVECACFDLVGQASGLSVAELLNVDARDSVPTNALVSNAEEANQALSRGFTRFKVKVGAAALTDDLRRVHSIRAVIGDNADLWLDANGAWSPGVALDALDRFAEVNPVWIEQPVRGLNPTQMAQLRAKSPIPIGLDEDLATPGQLRDFLDADALDVAVIKPMFVGGLQAAQDMIRAAEAKGIQVVITSALESYIGRQAAAHLAVGTARPIIAYGHGGPLTGDPHETSVTSNPVLYRSKAPGLGLGPKRSATKLSNTIANHAIARPGTSALVCDAGTWTWSAFHDMVRGIAAGLLSQGVHAGEIIALCGPNDHHWVACWHAINYVGAIGFPISKHLDDGRINAAVDACQADWLLLTDDSARSALSPSIRRLDIRQLDTPCTPHRWALDDIQSLLFSSGTTGPAKVVPLRVRQLVFSAAASALRLGHLTDDRWLACLPFEHMGGLAMIVRTGIYGTCLHLVSPFDAAVVNRHLEDGLISHISLVPTMLMALLDERGDQAFPGTLRCILVGGAAASARLLERSESLGAPVSITWGMSETASQVATAPPGEPYRDGSIGPPLLFTEVSVIDGRLAIEGPIAPHQPYVSQDLGRLDTDGWIQVQGRADDVINTGGKLVVPDHIEACLRDHPAIDDAAVVGIDDDRWGQRIVACLVTNHGNLTLIDIETWCATRLLKHERPKDFRLAPALERTDLGKLLRRRIRAASRAWPSLLNEG
ncbi:MAG: o-succinylbenzoate synthase [Myxococcota bacterium]|nr:o-succinylbenzoate synthase [Myxococcota bacterium]